MKFTLALVLLSLAGLARGADHSHRAATGPSATTPSLDIYPTVTRLHLLTATGTPPELSYRYSSDAGETWSRAVPVGIDQPAPHPIRRGQDAQLAASPDGKHLLAAWTTRGTADRFGRGPIATAYSDDAGVTWHPGPNPADDNDLATGHAFLDLAATPDGAFHLVWLDGRDGPDSGKGLRYARTTDAGRTWSKNQTLDAKTCECCWNTLKSSPTGQLAVLYRNVNCRDMSLLTSPDAGNTWSTSPPVGAFNWDINVCPHVGGGVAFSSGSTLLATVWTGSLDHVGAYTLRSGDAGATWSTPIRLPFRARHTDLATDARDPRRAAVVFDTTTDAGGNAIFAIITQDAGTTWSAPKRLSREKTTPTHPRVVATREGFRAFWTDTTGWSTALVSD